MPASHAVSAAGPAPDRDSPAVESRVALRVLEHIREFRDCVSLQGTTWGQDVETVPASLLLAATKIGGLAIGAYGGSGAMLGFVFSLSGADAQGTLHWSHMLAVNADARDAGIGRALKERQRDELAGRGVHRVAWTFDPLQSRNAHLNINRLRARVVEYVDDMYGPTGSPLHLGMATDRLVVVSEPDLPSVPPAPAAAPDDWPVLTLPERGGSALAELAPATLLVEVPWDIQAIVASDPALAARWRDATRRHFHLAMARGFAVDGFIADRSARRACYRFTRMSPAGAR